MNIYETVSGDTWDIISLKNYGSEMHIKELISANTKYIDTLIFKSGVKIIIPDLNIENINTKLPPWKVIK